MQVRRRRWRLFVLFRFVVCYHHSHVTDSHRHGFRAAPVNLGSRPCRFFGMREGFLLFDDHVITCGSWGGGGCVEIFYTLWVCIANRFHITAVVRWIVYIFLRLERSLVLFRGWWWWWRNILLSDLLGGNLRIQPWFSCWSSFSYITHFTFISFGRVLESAHAAVPWTLFNGLLSFCPARRSSLVHGGLDRPQLSEMLDR